MIDHRLSVEGINRTEKKIKVVAEKYDVVFRLDLTTLICECILGSYVARG